MISAKRSICIGLLATFFAAYAASSFVGCDALIDVLSPVVMFLSFFCLILNAVKVDKPRRLHWFFMSAVPLMWGVADILWVFWLPLFREEPESSVSLALIYAAANVLVAFCVSYFAIFRQRLAASIQYVLDSGAFLIIVLAAVYFVFLHQELSSLLSLSPLSAISFFCLLLDLIALTFSFSSLFSLRGMQRSATAYLLYSGVIVFCLSGMLYTYQLFSSTYVPDGLTDVGYAFAMTIVGIGAAIFDPHFLYSAPGSKARAGKASYWKGIVLLLVPVALSFLREAHGDEIVFFLVVILAYQVSVFVVARLSNRECDLEENSKQSELLERKVAERTAELKTVNDRLVHIVQHDAVTGLFSRSHFLDIADEWVAAVSPEDAAEMVWLIIADYDHFKSINDTYGHEVGDVVLMELAYRFAALSDERTVVARLGGDEFGLLCRRNREEDIAEVTDRIAALSDTPLKLGHLLLPVSLSVGAARYPSDAASRSDLMRHADMALYRSKQDRASRVFFFNAELLGMLERRHKVEFALRSAEIEKEFSLHYQPQFAIEGRRLIGMEALIRWDSPILGRVSPAEFINAAEETGIIVPLSDWLTTEALTRIADWNRRFGLALSMGINVSPVQLDDVLFLEKIRRAFAATGAESAWIKLEITEGVAMKSEDSVIDIFDALNDMGVSVAVDDFGTGYSSLAYLKKYKVDYLKVAKELIDDIENDAATAQMARAIISMSGAFGIKTIAEGVENESQFRLLEGFGCDQIQGYLLGKPVPADEFERAFLAPASSRG